MATTTIHYVSGSPATTVLSGSTATLTLVTSAGYQHNNRNVKKVVYALAGSGSGTLTVNLPANVTRQEVDIAFQAGDASCSAGWTAASAGTSETLTFTPTSSTVAMHAMVVGGGRSVDVDATA